MDLYSRRIVGWAIGGSMAAELALRALALALRHRCPPARMLYHSDRGVQYACGDFCVALADAQLVSSMSRKGNCYDNAAMESFWSTFKREGAGQLFASRRDLRLPRNLLQPCAAPQRARLPIPCGLRKQTQLNH